MQGSTLTEGADMNKIVDSILKHNSGREAERLSMKYRAMRENPFSFMRGTCHLYYEGWPFHDSRLNDVPKAWICGDLHLENFGSYKGDNRLVYFDMNDFDEAALAPAAWELGRWLASILVAASSLNLPGIDAERLCRLGLSSYSAALIAGKARWVERDTASGMIRSLLNPLRLRRRKAFLNSRTRLRKGMRSIRVDGKHALDLLPEEKSRVMAFVEEYARGQEHPGFYRPLDAARRIAGTGSLGLQRYAVLIEGRGSPDENFLLDLKQATPSALSPYLAHKQPSWESEAHRVVNVQQWVQAISPAFLNAVTFDGKPFLLKGLQPTADRLQLSGWNGKFKRLERVISSMGEIIAWGHLRSGGRAGAAIADEWIAFGERRDWQASLLKLAARQAVKIRSDWVKYAREYDKSGKSWC